MLKFIAIISWNTWFIWAFIFVFTLAHGIKETIKDPSGFNVLLLIAGISLVLMLAGLYY